MIQLRPDCMIFQTAAGSQIPCSAESATLELIGKAGSSLEPDVVENASAAVLHYFKHELNQNFVTVHDFAQAMEKVLRHLGLRLEPERSPVPVAEFDLDRLAAQSGEGWELFFFTHLREEIKQQLELSPRVLRFRGLRGCVQQLAGSPRWNRRCQVLNDQIVDYLRTCWDAEPASRSCALVVT